MRNLRVAVPLLLGVCLLAALLYLALRPAPPQAGGDTRPRAARDLGEPAAASEPTRASGVAEREPSPPAMPDEEPSLLEELFPEGDPAWAWARVDMEALRDELPDNRYWELAAPTSDPRVEREREETRERWNRELGKIMSNTATEAEVRAYYAERQRVSTDFVVFTDLLLERYGDVLPERDVGLLELSRRMHLSRLEEMPRRINEAIARRDAHAAVREAWLADQEAFGAEEVEGDSESDAFSR